MSYKICSVEIFPNHIEVLGEHRFYKSDRTSLDLDRLFHDSQSSEFMRDYFVRRAVIILSLMLMFLVISGSYQIICELFFVAKYS